MRPMGNSGKFRGLGRSGFSQTQGNESPLTPTLSAREDVVKAPPWAFAIRNRKNAIFRFLYFQWLTAIENSDVSLHRGGCCLLRHPPRREGRPIPRQVGCGEARTASRGRGYCSMRFTGSPHPTINPATKYVVLSASNRTRIKARLAVNGKPLSKAATPIRVLFEAPNKLIIKEGSW